MSLYNSSSHPDDRQLAVSLPVSSSLGFLTNALPEVPQAWQLLMLGTCQIQGARYVAYKQPTWNLHGTFRGSNSYRHSAIGSTIPVNHTLH